MADKLSEELARLGIPEPTEHVEPPRLPCAADLLRYFMRDVVWDRFDVDTAFDLLQEMELEVARLVHTLSLKGIRVVATDDRHADPRTGTTTLGGVTVRRECDHPRIRVTEMEDRARCRDCAASVNPVWWLARHASMVTRAEEWMRHVKLERRTLEAEVVALKAERTKLRAQQRRTKK